MVGREKAAGRRVEARKRVFVRGDMVVVFLRGLEGLVGELKIWVFELEM